MQAGRAIAAPLIALACCVTAAPASTQDADDGGVPLTRFRQAVDEYMNIHESVKRSLPPLDGTADGARIYARTEAMARGMRAARADAVEGELFGDDIATALRRVLGDLSLDGGCDVAQMLAFQRDEEEPPAPRPLIHDEFDWASGSFMPLCILRTLPEMPEELQFRFVGRDLVIVDLHSNLIVDVLPDALPAGESWPGVMYTVRRTSGGRVV